MDYKGKRVGEETTSSQKKNRWASWPGVVASLLVAAVTVSFIWQVWQTKLLPQQLMTYLCLGLGGVLLVAVLLLLNHRHVVRFVLGVILSVVLVVHCS